MLEERIEDLIKEQRETNRLLSMLVGKADSKPEQVDAVEEVETKPVKKTKASKPKPVDAEEKVEPKPEKSASGKTLKDIVELCSSGEVTRAMILSLLDEYKAKKLPDLDPKVVPEFYDRLVELKDQQSEAA